MCASRQKTAWFLATGSRDEPHRCCPTPRIAAVLWADPKKKGLARAKPLISNQILVVEMRRIELLTFALRRLVD